MLSSVFASAVVIVKFLCNRKALSSCRALITMSVPPKPMRPEPPVPISIAPVTDASPAMATFADASASRILPA